MASALTWLPKPILAERLTLRPTLAGDEEAIVALWTDPDVRRYTGGPLSPDEARRILGAFSPEPEPKFWGHFGIADRATDRIIGTVNFAQKRGPWEVSYSLSKERWGQGLAFEAVTAALDWFWSSCPNVGRVIAITQSANDRSRRLLERLGARMESEFVWKEALQALYGFSRPSNRDRDAS